MNDDQIKKQFEKNGMQFVNRSFGLTSTKPITLDCLVKTIKEIMQIDQTASETVVSADTQTKHKFYFDKICNLKDWKDEIRGYCREEEKEDIKQAIIFFTATEPSFLYAETPGWMKVYALGYRRGLAGPLERYNFFIV